MKYQPQLAKIPGKSQIDLAPGQWVRERKWDGMRAIFEIDSDGVKIFSRTGQDLLPQFPEFWHLHERFPPLSLPVVLDGEIVALKGCDADVEDLELLQLRLGDKLARRREDVPVTVRFFDILELMGIDARQDPLETRQSALAYMLDLAHLEGTEILPEGEEIPSFWEGVIAKRRGSKYCSGKRNADWLKFKFTQRATLHAVGMTPGKGARSNSFGAILVEDANGVPRGQVGSGFPEGSIGIFMLYGHQGLVEERPLIEVEYRFLSKTGLMVNTAFKGFRDDKVEADAL